jgi:hypothetical protein
MDALRQQQHRRNVPQVVDPDARQLGGGYD